MASHALDPRKCIIASQSSLVIMCLAPPKGCIIIIIIMDRQHILDMYTCNQCNGQTFVGQVLTNGGGFYCIQPGNLVKDENGLKDVHNS